MNLFDLFELCKLSLYIFLGLSLSVNHIDILVEVLFDLGDFLDYHCLDLGVLLIDLFQRAFVHLTNNFVKDLRLKLIFVVLGESVELRHSFQLPCHVLQSFQLDALFKFGICLLGCVLYLLQTYQVAIPDSLLVLKLSRVVEVIFDGAVELHRPFHVRIVHDLIGEDLMADENYLGIVFHASHSVASILNFGALWPDRALFEAEDFSSTQNSQLHDSS